MVNNFRHLYSKHVDSCQVYKYRSHLYFNHRCKDNKVLPFSLRFKPPIRSKKGYKLMVKCWLFLPEIAYKRLSSIYTAFAL